MEILQPTQSPQERKNELEGIFTRNALQGMKFEGIQGLWEEYMKLCSDIKVEEQNA